MSSRRQTGFEYKIVALVGHSSMPVRVQLCDLYSRSTSLRNIYIYIYIGLMLLYYSQFVVTVIPHTLGLPSNN